MDLSSWFRRTLMKDNRLKPTANSRKKPELDDEELGVTEELQNFVKSFTLDTFKNFPLPDDQITTAITNTQNDLGEWQERHATLVLSKVKEISQLRYVLCPRHLKERQFWRIYFALVKSYITSYEIRAIQKAKLRRIGKEVKEPLDSACEVEMSETKGATTLSPTS